MSISIIPVVKEFGGIIFVSGDSLIMNSFGTNSGCCKFFASIETHKMNIVKIICDFFIILYFSIFVILLVPLLT